MKKKNIKKSNLLKCFIIFSIMLCVLYSKSGISQQSDSIYGADPYFFKQVIISELLNNAVFSNEASIKFLNNHFDDIFNVKQCKTKGFINIPIYRVTVNAKNASDVHAIVKSKGTNDLVIINNLIDILLYNGTRYHQVQSLEKVYYVATVGYVFRIYGFRCNNNFVSFYSQLFINRDCWEDPVLEKILELEDKKTSPYRMGKELAKYVEVEGLDWDKLMEKYWKKW